MAMRRALVLTDESARNPFRASLAPQWREDRHELAEPRVPWRQRLALPEPLLEDVRGFMQTYCACVFAILAFTF
jgi:hypothetical protein